MISLNAGNENLNSMITSIAHRGKKHKAINIQYQ